jgi:hypothetical protein
VSDESREVPPDAHLRAALRHAPDREAAPPPGLSALILAQARQAAATATASHVPWFRRWGLALQALDRLLPSPALGGAVATVALATVIGVMWRGGPPADREEPSLADATAPVVMPAAPAPPPPVVPVRQPPAADSRNEIPAAQIPIASAPKVASPTRPTRRAKPVSPAGSAPPVRAAAKAAAAVPAQAAAGPVVDAEPETPRSADLAHLLASAQTAASEAFVPASGSAPQPLAALLAALRDQSATVQVLPGPRNGPQTEARLASAAGDAAHERSAGGEHLARKAQAAVDPSDGHEWLAQVARATEGRWQPVATPALDAGQPGHVIQVGGVPAGRLVLTGSGVLWLPGEGSGPAWQAGLEAPILQALRAQAPRR